MTKHLLVVFLLVLPMFSAGARADQQCKGVTKEIQKRCTDPSQPLQLDICSDEVGETVFILIDGTEALRNSSKEWIKSNVFSGDIIKFEEGGKGGDLVVTRMGEDPTAALPMQRVCFPTPKCNGLLCSPKKVQRQNQCLKCATADLVANNILDSVEGAGKSYIAESITEVFTNPRYRLKNNKHKRRFVLVSDLYQNSDYINFYNICTSQGPDHPVTCPSYEGVLKIAPKIRQYLVAATPKLRSSDEIYLFNLHAEGKGKIDQSAKNFWVGYFKAAGVSHKNIYFVPELDN